MTAVCRRWRLVLVAGLVAILLCQPAPGRAEPPRLRYQATWAGLPAAEIYLQLDDGDDYFNTRIEIVTLGLPRLLSHFEARADSAGAMLPGHSAVPARYDAKYRLRKKHKQVSIRYHPDDIGRLAEKGAADTGDHPLLPERLRRDVLDPLSCLAEIREMIRKGQLPPGGAFVIPVYDGKRRLDVEGSRLVEPAQPVGLAGKALQLRLLLRPIAGFRPDEREDEKIDDKPREVQVWLSDDPGLIPLRLSVSIVYLPAVVSFVGECSAALPCKAVMP